MMSRQTRSCDACVASRKTRRAREATQASQLRILRVLATMVIFSTAVYGQQTQPSARDAKSPELEVETEPGMQRAFAELADSQESVREAARAKLMALPRRYLPSLQKLVEKNRPLLPSQTAALRGIVQHIFLAGETYDVNNEFGFLGVRLSVTVVKMPPPPREPPVDAPDDAPQAEPEEEGPPETRIGVVITERLPGFVGSRLLVDGDIILSIAERPELEFPNNRVFSEVVKETPAGKPITFRLLRRGRVINVPIRLDPRPDAAATEADMQELDKRRREKAEDFWQKTFASLLKETIG
jgi:hypothetical protein